MKIVLSILASFLLAGVVQASVHQDLKYQGSRWEVVSITECGEVQFERLQRGNNSVVEAYIGDQKVFSANYLGDGRLLSAHLRVDGEWDSVSLGDGSLLGNVMGLLDFYQQIEPNLMRSVNCVRHHYKGYFIVR